MRPQTIVYITAQSHWEHLVSQFNDYEYRQSWNYGLVSSHRYSAKIERVAIKSGGELIGVATVRLKKIPFLRTGIAYVGGGPLTRRGTNDDMRALSLCLTALREEYLEKRGYTLRILPPVRPTGDNQIINDCFHANGFGDSPWPPPYRTVMVNINRPLPEIRKSLAQKWRNCLNNAERQGMTLQCGNDQLLFEKFRNLFERFIDRKQFQVALGADFFCDVRARATNDEGYLVCLAMKDGVPVAGHLVSTLGDIGVSILAATSEEGLKMKASYLLQWQVMIETQKRGMRWYDPGGIDPQANPGLYHFKSGLSGLEISEPGPFQAAPKGIVRSVTPALEKMYRWSKRFILRR